MDYRDPTVKTWRMVVHALIVIALFVAFMVCLVVDRIDMAAVIAVLFVGDQIADAIETSIGDLTREQRRNNTRVFVGRRSA